MPDIGELPFSLRGVPGIYRLCHVPSGFFYVGSTSDLWARRLGWLSWLKQLEAGGPLKGGNRFLRRVAALTDAADWKWSAVEVLFGVEHAELLRVEFGYIDRLFDDPLCLNAGFSEGHAPIGPRPRYKKYWAPPFAVLSRRLSAAQFKLLACRAEPDWFSAGCSKRSMFDGWGDYWLCPKRVNAFSVGDGGVAVGVVCAAEEGT